MNTAFWLSLVMALAGCCGLVLAGQGKWQGWAIGLAVQPVWAVFAVVTEGYGLLITCVMYGTVYSKNLLKWRRDAKKPEGKPLKVVFAGGYLQAKEWCIRNEYDLLDAIIVNSVQSIEGLRFTRDDVVFVGNYYERPDFVQIMELIESYTTRYGVRNG